ncbi:PspA/IM30 family protein [uncultured Clostridium sp.]|uniref:PspA/IM30 family protein n=1 Tax=uncultured Clostridium sp. TaxID=59620 RepID=UPI0025DD8955|nr:PspA/IM30 family protein [uncultured Clostridium sp.]
MSMLQRFKDIMSSNINVLLDKAEDPEKMIDQMIRNIQSDLGKIKSETATVMAEEARITREVNELKAEVEKMLNYATKAIQAGNDADAKIFLEKKSTIQGKLTDAEARLLTAKQNSNNMKAMHDKLNAQAAELNSRRAVIKSKIQQAKLQEKMNNMVSTTTGAASISKFDELEEKANAMLDKANAMQELNGNSNDVEDLMAKYDSTEQGNSAVDDELAALKAQMGIE